MKTTLFECLAVALHETAKDVHRRLLTRFARDVFHVESAKALLKRVAPSTVHDQALVDMLDGKHHRPKDAWHFVYYHRRDLRRSSSLRVFAELVWREFQRRVHIICTLSELDYYFDDDVIIIEKHSSSSFSLLDAPPLLLEPMKPLFMLRRSQDGVNLPVDVFQRVGTHCHVLQFTPRAPHVGDEVLYQIYTADESKTYYALPKHNVLQVFCCCANEPLKLLGETRDADNYVCFSLTEDVVAIVVVVCAADVKRVIAEETKFRLE